MEIKFEKQSDIEFLTIEKVKEIIDKDKNLSKREIDNTISAIKTVFASSVYLSKIKNNLYEIIHDGININDIPTAILVIIDTKNLIFSLLSSDAQISHKMMKYIIFSILYYNIIEDGIITEFEEKVLETFENTWKLLSYNPINLIKPASNFEVSCCYLF
jgi:hypothetical protein